MRCNSTISCFRDKISSALSSLIDSDYILLDVPYYNNIGDVLIWEGTKQFLASLNFNCIAFASKETFSFPELKKNVVILLMGGGNFGDLWRVHQDFRFKVLEHYPENKIIILPQTVYYRSLYTLFCDAKRFRQHKNVIICARDSVSYSLLSNMHFSKRILLLPDMAFCIEKEALFMCATNTGGTLFLKRRDAESACYQYLDIISHVDCVQDWRSFEKNLPEWILLENLIRCNSSDVDLYADTKFRPVMIKEGVRLFSEYSYIYTNRLHACILSLLLDKPVRLYDNSYGKNYAFYKTWLSDIDDIVFVKSYKVIFQQKWKKIKSLIKLILRRS